MPSSTPDSDRAPAGDAETLAAILADIVERRRRGEEPSAANYAARHPHLQRAIEEDIELVKLLEGAPGDPAEGPPDLSAAIAELPRHIQRAIVLRSLRRLPWSEVARELSLPGDALRREYAQAIKGLLVRCG